MKSLLFSILLFLGFGQAQAQNYIKTANDCFDNKQYQCAIDNYILALNQNSYKENDKYLIEYRIAGGYYKLNVRDKALEYYKKTTTTNPLQCTGFWDMADIYFTKADYSNALPNYKSAFANATNDSDKTTINWWIANTYFNLKQYNLAIPQFMNFINNAQYFKANWFIADGYYVLNKYDSAVRYYKNYLANMPERDTNKSIINCFIGKCFRKLNKLDEAMKYQDAALALKSNYTEARWEKGIVYASLKDYANAIEQYKKAYDLLKPDSADHFTLTGNIATCYQYLQKYADAIQWQQKRMMFSKNKYAQFAKIAQLQFGKQQQANIAENTCKTAMANYDLEGSALKKDANDNYVTLSSIAGMIALGKKDTVKALDYFGKALDKNKYNADANAGVADIYWQRKDYSSCLTHLNNILDVDSEPDFDTLITTPKTMANVYGRVAYINASNNSKPADYEFDVTNALYYDSLQKEAVVLWPRVLLADSYSLTKNRSRCIDLLNKAIKYYHTDPVYQSNLYNCKAVMLVNTDTAAIALALETAVKIAPDNIEPWDNLLKYYSTYNNAKGAIMVDKLIEVLKKKKDAATTATAYVYKGDFLWRLSKKEEAKKAWQEALVWDANNASAKERAKM
ncbi:MAG: tetratricopeptide repeat protein [Bacteroidetes bacterium]|nr:tetratricopeptide repeat protein [Bacteroidota bacterium]